MVWIAFGMAVCVGRDDIYLCKRETGLLAATDRFDRKRSSIKCQIAHPGNNHVNNVRSD